MTPLKYVQSTELKRPLAAPVTPPCSHFLHALQNSLKPEDDIASRRRANRERLEEELDELRTFKRIPAGELNASVPKTGWTTGYLAGEFGTFIPMLVAVHPPCWHTSF